MLGSAADATVSSPSTGCVPERRGSLLDSSCCEAEVTAGKVIATGATGAGAGAGAASRERVNSEFSTFFVSKKGFLLRTLHSLVLALCLATMAIVASPSRAAGLSVVSTHAEVEIRYGGAEVAPPAVCCRLLLSTGVIGVHAEISSGGALLAPPPSANVVVETSDSRPMPRLGLGDQTCSACRQTSSSTGVIVVHAETFVWRGEQMCSTALFADFVVRW